MLCHVTSYIFYIKQQVAGKKTETALDNKFTYNAFANNNSYV